MSTLWSSADPVSGKTYKDFVAFNVVGKIAAADATATRFSPTSSESDDLRRHRPARTRRRKSAGALMFRLAESVNAILVHDSVRQAVLAAGIDTLTLSEPEDWAG
jgi:hypothetical protein